MDTDEAIREEILGEFAWASRVPEAEIEVEVKDCVVTLTSAVSTYASKLAAEECAHDSRSVHDVINDVEVRPSGRLVRPDDELLDIARRVLEWDSLVPFGSVTVSVQDGIVTLTGRVHVLRQRDEAERAVRHLAAVRGVVNEITVVPYDVDVVDLHDRIRQALSKHGEHTANKIDITLGGRHVRLSGAVESMKEKRAVLGTARHAPGVERVIESLRIEGQRRSAY